MLERDVEKHFENKDRNGQFCFFAVKVRWQYVSTPVKNGAGFNRPHLIQNENDFIKYTEEETHEVDSACMPEVGEGAIS